jgi:uncharacterized protein (TIGR02145 family)
LQVSHDAIIFNSDLIYGTVADIDGNEYKTITIGSQTWMAENLRTTRYRNGDLIGTTTSATLDISLETKPKYEWAYNADETNVVTYGRLYTWYTITDSRNICPDGWHVPTDAEWITLTPYLGGESDGFVAGAKLKEIGTTHWQSPNPDATNASGFTALPGGNRHFNGTYEYIGYYSFWWSSTGSNYANQAWYWLIHYNNSSVGRYSFNERYGLSVRCLQD